MADRTIKFRRFEVEEEYKGHKFFGFIEKIGNKEGQDLMKAEARMDGGFLYETMEDSLSPDDNEETQSELIESIRQGIRNIQDEEHETPFVIGISQYIPKGGMKMTAEEKNRQIRQDVNELAVDISAEVEHGECFYEKEDLDEFLRKLDELKAKASEYYESNRKELEAEGE